MSSKSRVAALIAATVALLPVPLVTAAGNHNVVPPGGKVAGQGYGQWLGAFFQTFLATPPGASVCQSVPTSIGTVAVLIGGTSGKEETHTCVEPAGQPIFVDGLAADCSTVEPAPYHGNTPAQLKSCARRNLRGATDLSISIDGHPVSHWMRFISASPVLPFHMPKHNVLGTHKRSGRFAAYGEGLLIRGLTRGTHIVHETGHLPGFSVNLTYRLRVR